jgi:hypothetical protein
MHRQALQSRNLRRTGGCQAGIALLILSAILHPPADAMHTSLIRIFHRFDDLSADSSGQAAG